MKRFIASLLVLILSVGAVAQAAPAAPANPPSGERSAQVEDRFGIPKETKYRLEGGYIVVEGTTDVVASGTDEFHQPGDINEDGGVFLYYRRGTSPLAVCGTPWETVVRSEGYYDPADPCLPELPAGLAVLGYEDLTPDGYAGIGSSVIYTDESHPGLFLRSKNVTCPDVWDPWGGCMSFWGRYIPTEEVWGYDSNPHESDLCPIGDGDTAPPDIPEGDLPPFPEIPETGAAEAGGPDPAVLAELAKWASESAAKARKANEKAKAETRAKNASSGGVGAEDVTICREGRSIVVNGEEFTLSNEYPILEQEGKVFYPASIEAAEKLGFALMHRRERKVVGNGQRIVHLANGNTSVAFWPESASHYTVWDVQTQWGEDRVESFRAAGDEEIYYFDLRKVVEFAGGWVRTPEETTDGKYHIFIPWSTKGTWLRSCEMRGYTIDNGRIPECPIDLWMVGSTWDYLANRPGSDAFDVIMVAQGLFNKHWLSEGEDTAEDAALRRQLERRWAVIGLRHEGMAYSSFMYPLLPWLEETSLGALEFALSQLGYGYRNQLHVNPSRFARLADDTLEAAKAERLYFAGILDRVKRHILEKGWNWLDLPNGKRVYLPIRVAPAESMKATQAGWHASVNGLGPYGIGGWYNQAKVGGTPDPIIFKLELDGKTRTYVLTYEWADETGHFADSQGEVVIEGWTGEKTATVEVKSGYEKYVDKKTGYFDTDFQSAFMPQWLEDFEKSISNSRANGRGHIMVFTNKAVHDAFHKAVKLERGEQFYNSNSHRIVLSTRPVVRISEPAPPLPPCPPGFPCP